jgi:hypothetical protein
MTYFILSSTVRFKAKYESISAWPDASLMTQHRDGAVSTDFGDEGFLMFCEKPGDGREGFHEDARHFFALKIPGGQDECRDSGVHQCGPL